MRILNNVMLKASSLAIEGYLLLNSFLLAYKYFKYAICFYRYHFIYLFFFVFFYNTDPFLNYDCDFIKSYYTVTAWKKIDI